MKQTYNVINIKNKAKQHETNKTHTHTQISFINKNKYQLHTYDIQ